MKVCLSALLLLLPVFVFASEHPAGAEETGIPFSQIGWQALNLGILLAALYYFVKKSIIEAFANRQKVFYEQSAKTKMALNEAEKSLQEVKSKLRELEANEKASIEKASKESQLLKENLVKDAEYAAEKLKADSQLVLRAELEKAKQEMSEAILSGAIASATQIITSKTASISKTSEEGFLNQLNNQLGQVKL